MNPPSSPAPADPRIYWAAERTLLAWIRTGMAFMGFGLVIAKLRFFLDEMLMTRGTPTPVTSNLAVWGGILLVALGVFMTFAASVRHFRYLKALDRWGADAPVPRKFPLLVASVLVLAGVFLAVRLVVTAQWLETLPAPPSAAGRSAP